MARLTTSSDAHILITLLVMARSNIFWDTESDGTSEAAVVVVDEEGFDLALARSSLDVAFAVVVVEDGLDLALARSSPDVAFAVIVVEDGFDLALARSSPDVAFVVVVI